MPKSYKLHVITPSKMFYEGAVEMVIVKTPSGEEGFMANHAWACKLLDTGPLWIQEAGQKDFKSAAISGGFIDVMEDIIIYTDTAEWHTDIDTDRAKNTQLEAEKWLTENKNNAESVDQIIEVKDVIKRQEVRVKIAKAKGERRGK